MRRALAPVADVAERTGAVVVVVRHLNKAPGGNPIYRGGGSIGIIGAARVGLLVAQHPEDEQRRVLAPIKTNLGAPPPSLSYRLVEADGDVARIEWEGTSEVTAAQLLVVTSGDSQGERTAIDEAQEFLRVLLADGPVPSKRALKEARELGIADRTLHRARSAIGVRATKQGMQGGWTWSLPKDCQDVAAFEDCQGTSKLAKPPGWQPSEKADNLREPGGLPEAIA